MLAKDQYPVNISKTGVMLLNSLEGLVPLAIVAWLNQEFQEAGPAFRELSRQGVIWISLSCVVGVGVGYTGIWAQSNMSATSFLVLANANKGIVVLVEPFCTRTKALEPIQVAGAAVAILGAAAFGAARGALESEAAAEAQEEKPLLDKKV
mmetsp:Transcript_33702/g.96426  ORF Transcript_33702/g.96426 Transcript_33702/m.96426 type:complete len:151 (-) Transcript_33702:40-492(-)